MSTSALVLAFTVSHQAADLVLVALALAAGLESILGYCLGCRIFGLLMRVGVVPEAVCEECADVSRHVRATVRARTSTGARQSGPDDPVNALR